MATAMPMAILTLKLFFLGAVHRHVRRAGWRSAGHHAAPHDRLCALAPHRWCQVSSKVTAQGTMPPAERPCSPSWWVPAWSCRRV